MNKKYKSIDGLTLNYREQGEGLSVICLPGLTRNSNDFNYLLPHVSGVRFILPDYRGRGESDWAEPKTYTVPVEAGDILALMDHLEIEKAALIGTSRGGLISMALASAAKDRLLGVCLNDIGPDIPKEGLDAIVDYVGTKPKEMTYTDAAKNREAVSTGFRNVAPSRWLEEVQAHYIETATGLELRYDPRLKDMFADFASKPAPDLWPYFDALSGLPLALLRGETSDVLSRETADQMIERRPDMIFAEVADRGHIPFLDEPESLTTIRAWLGKMQ